ncbi:substrate-binding domain-containing protein [Chloroflexus sp.]|uniref:substrate-binding domain-containing protein n=1 Tax=Chloroflexus sp. TaxID=1904827 RepID=UPI004049A16C
MKLTKSHLFPVVLLIFALLLAACTPQAQTPTPTSAPAPTPISAPAPTTAPSGTGNAPITLRPGLQADIILLPKFLGIAVFDQAHEGAKEAHAELGNLGQLIFTGPTAENSVAGQIETLTNAATQGVKAVMLSNNAGDQIAAAAQAAQAAGVKVITWDSPIPSAQGESVFVAQVDFNETGRVMADMALSILGPQGGEFAILSASPDAANQNAWIAAMKQVRSYAVLPDGVYLSL